MVVKISKITKGQVVGFNDFVDKRPHTVTVRCVTTKGSLYSIDGDELVSKLKRDRTSWQELLAYCKKQDQDELQKGQEIA